MVKKTHYIYGLIDPRINQLFYIGVTCDLETRREAHSKGIGNGFKKKSFTKQMLDEGFTPQMVVLQTCDGKSAKYLEKQWIQSTAFLGAGLINEKHSTEKTVDIRGKIDQYVKVKSELDDLKKRIKSMKTQVARLLGRI